MKNSVNARLNCADRQADLSVRISLCMLDMSVNLSCLPLYRMMPELLQ